MNIETICFNLYQNKLEWAYRAKRKFVESLKDESVRSLYNDIENGEVNVSVYGKSQVGKTTLILKLIGIKEEYMESVSSVLRGKRSIGNSATATAMIYSKSEDNLYYATGMGQVHKTQNDLEMTEWLALLRKKAEANVLSETDKVHIFIPKKFFNNDQNRLNINVIDLPGINSSEEKEQRHVNKIIAKFIPISNLILLIERADQLASLKSIFIPGIADWRDNLERFRIVLTRSVSNNSTLHSLESARSINKETYIKIFKEELYRNVDIELPTNGIFPLEYGESWSVLRRKNKELQERLSPLINDLHDLLITEIEKSQNPYNLLMANAKLYKSTEKVLKRNIARHNQQIEDSIAEIKATREKLKVINSEIDSKIRKIERLSGDRMKSFELLQLKREKFGDSQYNSSHWKKVTGLKMFLNSYRDMVYKDASEFIVKFNETNPDCWLANNVAQTFKLIADPMLKFLENNYIIDSYFRDSSWFEDMARANYTVLEIAAAVEDEINNNAKRQVEGRLAKLSKTLKTLCDELETDEQYLREKTKELDYLETVHENLLKKKETYITVCQRDLDTAKSFVNFIQEGFLTEFRAFIYKLNSNNTSVPLKAVYLDYLIIISDEMTKLEEQLL